MDLDDLDEYAEGPLLPNEGAADRAGDDAVTDKPKKRRASVRKRPKLTLEHLQKTSGLQGVFDNIPKWFKDGYRGKGHEVRDLRRLLELYQRWQPRVFPHGSYNQFESALEKMSGTSALKDALNNMRQELQGKVEAQTQQNQQQDQQQDQDEEHHQQQQQQQWQAELEERNAGGLHGYDDIDEEELLALQAQDATMKAAEEAVPEAFYDVDFDDYDPAPSTAAARTAATVAAPAHTAHATAGSDMHAAKRTMRDWSDDDNGFDDAGQYNSMQQQRQGAATAMIAAADGRRASLVAAADSDAEGGESGGGLLNDLLRDEEVVRLVASDGGGIGSDEPASSVEADGSGRPQRKRLQRTTTLQDSSDDEAMLDVQATGAAGENGADSQQQCPNNQRQRRHWQLADDDSDHDSAPEEDDTTAGRPQQGQGGTGKRADTHHAGKRADTHHDGKDVQPTPLAPHMAPVGCETVDEMQLFLGTDLDGLQHHQQ